MSYELVTLDDELSPDELRRREALKFLALARQADPDVATASAYLVALRDLDPGLLEEACYQLANEPRPDYGSALPDVGTIRARASRVARERREAERRAKVVLALPTRSGPDEPTFFCTRCFDEPSGWQIVWCPGTGDARQVEPPKRALETRIAPCGRRPNPGLDHLPHTYAERCGCYETNPVIARHRERERKRQQERAAKA